MCNKKCGYEWLYTITLCGAKQNGFPNLHFFSDFSPLWRLEHTYNFKKLSRADKDMLDSSKLGGWDKKNPYAHIKECTYVVT